MLLTKSIQLDGILAGLALKLEGFQHADFSKRFLSKLEHFPPIFGLLAITVHVLIHSSCTCAHLVYT